MNAFLASLRQQTLLGWALRYGLAAGAVAAGMGLRLALTAWVGPGLPTYVTFYPAVMAAALLAGFGPGLVATALAGLTAVYWILPPEGFAIASPVDRLGLAVFTGMGLFMSAVAALYRRDRSKAAAYDREVALRESRARLAAFAEATFEGIVESEAGRIVDCNEQFARTLGYSVSELKGVEIAKLISPQDRDRVMATIRQGREAAVESTMLRKDGTVVFVEGHGRPMAPDSARSHVAIRDITERKQREAELLKLNRILRAIGDSNQAMMRITDEAELLHETCRIVVEDCGHRMVWIGYAEEDADKTVRPVAHAGFEAGYVETLKITWADTERGRGPTGTAIRTGKPVGCKNMLADPAFAPWRAEALRRGYASSMVIPLVTGGKAFGAINIYSAEPDPFSADEVRLLTELAGDLAYGITALRARAARERAEEALRQSEARLATVVRSSPTGIFITRLADGLFLEANDAYLRITGYSAEEVVGHTSTELNLWVNPGDRDRIIGAIRDHGRLDDFEVQFRRKSGEVVDLLASALPLEREGEACILGTLADITERKQSERTLHQYREHLEELVYERTGELRKSTYALEAERRRFHEVLNALPAYVVLLTPDYRVPFANRFFEERFGKSEGRRCYDYLFKRGEPCENCETFKVLKTGAPHHWEWLGPDGRNYDIYDFPFTDSDGSPLILEMGLDITEQKRAEEAVRQAGTYNRSLIEASLDPLVTISPDGKIRDANAATEWATGLSREQLIGSNFADYFTEPEKAAAGYRRVLAEGRVSDYPLTIRHVSGDTTDVLYNATVYRNEAGEVQGIFAAARDVTALQRAEAELRKAGEQLAQAQKMEAVGRLAGGVAHDFNNLMTVVTGFGRRVLRDGALASGHRTAVEQMIQAGERAVNLTRQLLAFSRKQIVSPVVLDLNGIVNDMRKMMPTLLGEDVTVALELAPGLRPVLADPTQITQVLMNLGSNARDAMPTGGLLTIRTADVQAPSAAGRVHGDVPPGRYALLAISDTGTGMSEETRGHLFEPFFTTKRQGEGTGLGLSSVYGIVQQSGGHIRVDTALGRGTTFSIYFPASAAEARGAASPRASTGQPAGAPDGSETILLVEDEAGVRDLLAADLQDLGYRVLPGRTVGEALRAMEAHQGPIDLLLTDVILPGMSGPTLAKTLQARGKVRHVLFMSGHTEKHIAPHGVLEPGVEFIGKPFTTEALVQKIRGLLDGQTARQ